MLVSVTRTVSALTLKALFYSGLFVGVVVAHLGISAALRQQGWGSGLSLMASGAVVLGGVLMALAAADWLRDRQAAADEAARRKQRLPDGPCSVVWRDADRYGEEDEAMQWELAGPLRTRYPRLARRLGIEGVAIAAFEVSAQGRAKNIHCIVAWPYDAFYAAARDALARARFEPKPDIHVRYGEVYRMPFVFRLKRPNGLRHGKRRPQGFPLVGAAPLLARFRTAFGAR